MRRRSEDILSTYTVHSNCEGGTVLFDNINVGIISNGRAYVRLRGEKSYLVSIQGGLPSSKSSTTSEKESGEEVSGLSVYPFNGKPVAAIAADAVMESTTKLTFHFVIEAQTDCYLYRIRTLKPWTRTNIITTTYYYSAPAAQKIYPGQAVYMNYTKSDPVIRVSQGNKVYSSDIKDSGCMDRSSYTMTFEFNSMYSRGYSWTSPTLNSFKEIGQGLFEGVATFAESTYMESYVKSRFEGSVMFRDYGGESWEGIGRVVERLVDDVW